MVQYVQLYPWVGMSVQHHMIGEWQLRGCDDHMEPCCMWGSVLQGIGIPLSGSSSFLFPITFSTSWSFNTRLIGGLAPTCGCTAGALVTNADISRNSSHVLQSNLLLSELHEPRELSILKKKAKLNDWWWWFTINGNDCDMTWFVGVCTKHFYILQFV